MILLHGMGGSSDWWRRNVPALAREHLVVALDLIGSGWKRSALPPTMDDIAALLARWISDAFDERVHIIGNSMGGHIAMHIVALRPDLVRSLTLVNSTGIPFELKPGAHVENLIFPAGALSFGKILARDALRSPSSIAGSFAKLLRDDARDLMRDFNLPALVVWGEHDPLVPLKYGTQIADTIPNARLVTIARAGHIPMWENAEAFNAAVTQFLRDVDQQPTTDNRQPTTRFSWPIRAITNGIAHRATDSDPDIVLIHGLGMSSAYFENFARALHARGFHPAAPDIPGFGESANAPAMSPRRQAAVLTEWADALKIRDAVWVGHSLGCNVVAHLRPGICRRGVMIGPLWSKSPFVVFRLLAFLVLDAFREPLRVYEHVMAAYWRCGLWRWWMSFFRALRDLREPPPEDALMMAGVRDPLPDRRRVHLTEVPGAHACHFSHPEEAAEPLSRLRERVPRSGG